MESNTLSFFDRFNQWLKESITVKLASIGFLLIILLIPSAWIQSIMEERQQRAESVIEEISSKWSGSQTLAGPVLVVPFKQQETIYRANNESETREVTHHAYFLPEELTIEGQVQPEVLNRGIFEAAVYQSTLSLSANFNSPDFDALKIEEEDILWGDAHIVFSISDLRGISEDPVMLIGEQTQATEPSSRIGVANQKLTSSITSVDGPPGTENGIIARLDWNSSSDFDGRVSLDINLKGSEWLAFVPVGKTTSVNVSGPWQDPSFDGEFLPVNRTLESTGFSAQWQVLHFNRPFSQQWVDKEQDLKGTAFGTRLLIPVDQYQKSIRTAKYGILVILLTFISLFMVEIVRKVRIHPFQYILIGAALSVYYSLLLSLSEHLGFNLAYLVASAAVIALVIAYSSSFLKTRGLVMLFSAVLLISYTFIYVIIQLQDFSLLIGSIGLFLIIAALMYFSRKVNWYSESLPEKSFQKLGA